MSRIATSAPGKLILFGEYAVLEGEPATVMAVDRRARVILEPSGGERFSVFAPGLIPEPASFVIAEDGRLDWVDSDSETVDRLVLVRQLLTAMTRSGMLGPRPPAPFTAELDTREFFMEAEDGRQKLGLGSSAALTAALASALAGWCGRGELLEQPLEWLRSLLALHREFQGGRGSGVDLAASVLGGTLRYRLDGSGAVAEAEAIELPDGLHLACLFTGHAASTAGYLARLDEARRRDPSAVEAALERLGAVARSAVDGLTAARVGEVLDCVDAFCEALEELGRAARLDILSEAHLKLRELATRSGVRYKPSGAGGGDIGIAFSDDADALARLESAARTAGFVPLDLTVDPTGLNYNFVPGT
jgi:phosphomevalonate kinase